MNTFQTASKVIYEIKEIYENELLNSEFSDDISIKEELVKIDSFEIKKYDRIVFYGSFFNLTELHWILLSSFIRDNSNEILFIGNSGLLFTGRHERFFRESIRYRFKNIYTLFFNSRNITSNSSKNVSSIFTSKTP